MNIKSTKINAFAETIIQSAVLIVSTFIFMYAVISKKALLYVHARHTGIIVFASAIFFITGILQLKKLFFFNDLHTKEIKPPLYLFIFIAPLVFSFISSNKALTLDSLAFNMDISSQKHSPIKTPQSSSKLLELQDGFIVMDDDTFGRWLSELYLNLNLWTDKKIKIEGSIWKNPDMFGETEFAIGRMMMVCCAADMQPVGVIASWAKAADLQDDEWVRITGTVATTEYEGEYEPIILVESVEKITRPQLEYIYPF